MDEETSRSQNAHLPTAFSVTLLSRFVCVYMCAREEHIYDPWSQRDGKGKGERVRSCFSLLFLFFFFSPFFFTRHYDRIYQRRRLKKAARWWSHRVRSRDIFRRNEFDPSSFFLFLIF
jgi:hypothetical protein